jgi:hypothetical protein
VGERYYIAEAIPTNIVRKRDRIDPIAPITGVSLRGIHHKEIGHDRIPEG